VLRIRRFEGKGAVTFALSGRIEEGDVPELRNLLDAEAQGAAITLDLEELRLVDRQMVKFLADCQARGIVLKNCPAYVRQWMGIRSSES
jgi:hypothetical protein